MTIGPKGPIQLEPLLTQKLGKIKPGVILSSIVFQAFGTTQIELDIMEHFSMTLFPKGT